jgi:hypothetical protein
MLTCTMQDAVHTLSMINEKDFSRQYLSNSFKYCRDSQLSQGLLQTVVELFVPLVLDTPSLSHRFEQEETLRVHKRWSQRLTEISCNCAKDDCTDWTAPEPQLRPDSKIFDIGILKERLHLRIIITQRGFLAVLSPWVKYGDRLFVVFGTRVILILRPVPGTDRKTRFEIIGDALVLQIRGDAAVHPRLRKTDHWRQRTDRESELRN